MLILVICAIVVGVINLCLLLTLASFLFKLGDVMRDVQSTVDAIGRTYMVDEPDLPLQDDTGLVDLQPQQLYDDPRLRMLTASERAWLKEDLIE